MRERSNRALHLTAIALRFIVAGEHGRRKSKAVQDPCGIDRNHDLAVGRGGDSPKACQNPRESRTMTDLLSMEISGREP